jgi:hypothetical protein
MLKIGSHASETRIRQQFMTERGISSAPAMALEGKYLLTSAKGA